MGFRILGIKNPLIETGKRVFVSNETFLKKVVDKTTSSSKNRYTILVKHRHFESLALNQTNVHRESVAASKDARSVSSFVTCLV